VPTQVQQHLSNAYDNLEMPRRVVNHALSHLLLLRSPLLP
jgi:ABC-type transporter lipoprotein component MlaA